MTSTSPACTWDNLIEDCARLVEYAKRHGSIPISWMVGPDVRAKVSEKLDRPDCPLSAQQQEIMMRDGMLPIFGLPCLPMITEGVALRTVKAQESGVDL